jgi:hypothetical protein
MSFPSDRGHGPSHKLSEIASWPGVAAPGWHLAAGDGAAEPAFPNSVAALRPTLRARSLQPRTEDSAGPLICN